MSPIIQQPAKEFYSNYSKGYNKYIIESIYLNKLSNQRFQNIIELDQTLMDGNPKKTYSQFDVEHKLNNYGFRDEDFDKCADILISGCSQTYGVALPEEYRFFNIIKNNISSTIHNIAFPGASVSSIVRLVFAYIKEFGNPKYIYIMLPPFERFEFSPDFNRFETEMSQKFNYIKKEKHTSPLHVTTYTGDNLNVQKAPYYPEYTVNLASIHFWQAQSLLMLEQYCDMAGIKFAWSTWSTFNGIPDTIINLQKRNLGYSSYYDLPFKQWSYDHKNNFDNLKVDENCHNDLKVKRPDIFDGALDSILYRTGDKILDKDRIAHWGSHRNAHVAELILKYMQDVWSIK